jgi:hypothetical protein
MHSDLRRRLTAFSAAAGCVVALVLIVCVADAADVAAGTNTPVNAVDQLDQARAEAAVVAARIADSEAEHKELEGRIARTEADLDDLVTRAARLQAMVRERAVVLYKREGPRFDALVNTQNVVDGARASQLIEIVGAHDRSFAARLQANAREVDARRIDLRRQRSELERTITALEDQRDQLERDVSRAVSASRRAQVVTISQAGVDVPALSGGLVWETFRECTFAYESGGNYQVVSPGGLYHGAWQFLPSTWNAVAARMDRNDLVGVLPSQAAPNDQDAVAHQLWLESGNRPWGGRC